MDPPFDKGMAASICQKLESGQKLTVGAKIYVEIAKQQTLDDMPENWKLLKQSQAGDVRCFLFQNT